LEIIKHKYKYGGFIGLLILKGVMNF